MSNSESIAGDFTKAFEGRTVQKADVSVSGDQTIVSIRFTDDTKLSIYARLFTEAVGHIELQTWDGKNWNRKKKYNYK